MKQPSGMVPPPGWYSGGQKKMSNSYFYVCNKVNAGFHVFRCAVTVLDANFQIKSFLLKLYCSSPFTVWTFVCPLVWHTWGQGFQFLWVVFFNFHALRPLSPWRGEAGSPQGYKMGRFDSGRNLPPLNSSCVLEAAVRTVYDVNAVWCN